MNNYVQWGWALKDPSSSGNVNGYVTHIYSKYERNMDGNNKTSGHGWEKVAQCH